MSGTLCSMVHALLLSSAPPLAAFVRHEHTTLYNSVLDYSPAMLQKGGEKLGYETEAFAIYDTMRYVKPAVHTLCVGNAFGESAMLLAAGEQVSMHCPCTCLEGKRHAGLNALAP